jgi:hypothetical protein
MSNIEPPEEDLERDRRGGERFSGTHDDEPDVPEQPHPEAS